VNLNYHIESANPLDFEKKANWNKVSVNREITQNSDKVIQCVMNSIDERLQRYDAAKAINKEKPPRANAFAVTALCLQDEYLSRSLDLVQLAFEEQPNLSYCLYMMSNETVPTIALRGFNYIKTRPGISFDQSLYIIHRAYFFAEIYLNLERVREEHVSLGDINGGVDGGGSVVSAIDNNSVTSGRGGGSVTNDLASYHGNKDNLADYLSHIPSSLERDEIYNHLQYAFYHNDIELIENPDDIAFSIMISAKIVGLIIFSKRMLSSEDLSWYRLHYSLDDYLNYDRFRLRNQYVILDYIIDPIFSAYTRVILQECMRKCMKAVFYYHHMKQMIPAKEIVEDFIFIRPRCFPQGQHIALRNRPKLVDSRSNEEVALPQEDCPLYMLSKGFLCHYKTIVSKRMVIIGGSSHSQAFLETLTSISHLYLPNIYYIVDILPAAYRLADQQTSAAGATAGGGANGAPAGGNPNVTTAGGNGNILTSASMMIHPSKYVEEADLYRYDLDQNGCLTIQDIDQPLQSETWAMGFAYRCNIIKGRLTDIDRENKAVVISDELVIEYDYLLISSWTQGKCSMLNYPTELNHSLRLLFAVSLRR
jgi:hypothetical protein